MRAESQRLHSELNRKDDSRTDPKKNFKGQPVFNVDMATQNDEQSIGQRGNGRKKGKGRSPSTFQGYMPEATLQQAEYCTVPFNNGGNRERECSGPTWLLERSSWVQSAALP